MICRPTGRASSSTAQGSEIAGRPSALAIGVKMAWPRGPTGLPSIRSGCVSFAGHGMAAVVGRVRECPLLDLKLTLLSHNLVRGAAGAALLNAELLASRGYLKERSGKESKKDEVLARG